MAVLQGVTLLVMFGGIWVFRGFIDRRSMRSLGLDFGRVFRKDFGMGILWGVGLVGSVFVVLLIAGYIEIIEVRFPAGTVLIMIPVLCFSAFEEELVMRGYLLNNFLQSVNKWVALLFTATLFALLHGGNPNIGPVALANIVLAGLVLGIYYIHRGNLWFPFGLHWGWNYFQGVVFGSPVSGINIPSVMEIEITGDPLWTGGAFGFEASLVTTIVIVIAIVMQHVVYRGKPEVHPGNAAPELPSP